MNRSAPPAAAARLRLCVVRLARRVRQHAGADVTPSQISALSTIAKHEPLRPGALADKERISKSSVTRLIGRLEERGYIERRADETDGRSHVVTLTPEGRQLLVAADQQAEAYLARQLAALDERDRQLLEGALPALEQLLAVRA